MMKNRPHKRLRASAVSLLFFGAFGLAVSASLPARADDDQDGPRCRRHGSQTEETICASQAYQKANTAMWTLYQRKLDYLRSDYSRARLREAQRLWMQYLNASCLYENGLEQDAGSDWKERQLNCLTDHTKRRSAVLRSYVNCTKDETCPI